MKKQTIYVALALNPDKNGLVALCWHTDKSRAGDVGTALTQQNGLAFFGVTSCENADFEADSSFPDDHWLNAKKT
ncbi:hypothetical protein [Nostoc sp. DedQUE09]|uniref:hypothetical protein n=1 Tax=Nostoc sp. DedQUE09 TaxID=3075394 RepID=UPI002AD5137A|nr:hypothetical protein [Nostoc sp. DedQUE09]MDZ7953346.1 hypothetical protein [Nostoc sp. DedQUE09]MDZ7953374.1 hypothetical protein [Nostoc sp. DedQUE09]